MVLLTSSQAGGQVPEQTLCACRKSGGSATRRWVLRVYNKRSDEYEGDWSMQYCCEDEAKRVDTHLDRGHMWWRHVPTNTNGDTTP